MAAPPSLSLLPSLSLSRSRPSTRDGTIMNENTTTTANKNNNDDDDDDNHETRGFLPTRPTNAKAPTSSSSSSSPFARRRRQWQRSSLFGRSGQRPPPRPPSSRRRQRESVDSTSITSSRSFQCRIVVVVVIIIVFSFLVTLLIWMVWIQKSWTSSGHQDKNANVNGGRRSLFFLSNGAHAYVHQASSMSRGRAGPWFSVALESSSTTTTIPAVAANFGRNAVRGHRMRRWTGSTRLLDRSKDDDGDDSNSESNNVIDNNSSTKNTTSNDNKSKQRQTSKSSRQPKTRNAEDQKKQEILRQVQAKLEEQRRRRRQRQQPQQEQPTQNKNNNLPLPLNPFQAGQEFRRTIDSLARGLASSSSSSSSTSSSLSSSATSNRRRLQDQEDQEPYYYLDDRFLEPNGNGGGSSSSSSSSNAAIGRGPTSLFGADSILLRGGNDALGTGFNWNGVQDDEISPPLYVPEVLVVGATGEVGRLVVRRLLLEGRSRVRVLVRDLYSDTLNLLGTGVTYCQGDLSNVESLEYALTDVDKIVYVAGAPRPDEREWKGRLERLAVEYNSDGGAAEASVGNDRTDHKTTATLSNQKQPQQQSHQWDAWMDTLETRAELAKQVDHVGMRNLIQAYQNVRHADFGTSQAAKRSLFKFSGRPGDFSLFSLDDGSDEMNDAKSDPESAATSGTETDVLSYTELKTDEQDPDDDKYDDRYEDWIEGHNDYDHGEELLNLDYASTDGGTVKTQVQWMRNTFGNGVFVGRVPQTSSGGGEAAIVSSRLRSRDDPECGIDLQTGGFAGFIVRLVADGGNYEAFVRTKSYLEDGIEYVCGFPTDAKPTSVDNKSRNRFKTVRLGFDSFRPVQRKRPGARKATVNEGAHGDYDEGYANVPMAPPFRGNDIQQIGFRFRAAGNIVEATPERRLSNPTGRKRPQKDDMYKSFYLALDYVKVYRVQPEPEFIYLSDARIPSNMHSVMVDHTQRRLVLTDHDRNGRRLLDDKILQAAPTMERSPEETYYKYRGEEILKGSGLSYTIVRVAGFNELPTSEASTIALLSSQQLSDENEMAPVSRAEAAQVCVSALMDPSALNKSVYMSKKKTFLNGRSVFEEEDISAKFEALPRDGVS